MDLSSKVALFNVNYRRPYWVVTLSEASLFLCSAAPVIEVMFMLWKIYMSLLHVRRSNHRLKYHAAVVATMSRLWSVSVFCQLDLSELGLQYQVQLSRCLWCACYWLLFCIYARTASGNTSDKGDSYSIVLSLRTVTVHSATVTTSTLTKGVAIRWISIYWNNQCSWERKFQGKVPWSESSNDRKLQGVNCPRSKKPRYLYWDVIRVCEVLNCWILHIVVMWLMQVYYFDKVDWATVETSDVRKFRCWNQQNSRK